MDKLMHCLLVDFLKTDPLVIQIMVLFYTRFNSN